jgi:hypothetical protein
MRHDNGPGQSDPDGALPLPSHSGGAAKGSLE